jgi:Cu(I)/Ag(I) efflux system membrane fusion protein
MQSSIAGAVLLAAGLGLGWSLARLQPAADPHAATAAASAPAAASAVGRQVLYWYDPMVPTQKFDKPGKSPFMDMALVPRYADEAAAAGVAVSPQAAQSLGLRLAVAEKRALAPAIDVVGTVALNQREVAIVQARSAGFVERVVPHAPGDVVAAGAPLAELLHPEWLAAQLEYLGVRRTGDEALSTAARQRLLLLGMPTAVVDRIERRGEPEATSVVSAPMGGLIAELEVRQGMSVAAGATLARINGLDTVWVEAAVPEALAGALRPGQAAKLRFAALPGEVVRGRVGAVLPEAAADSRTLRVRIELPNPGRRLRAGMFAQVAIEAGAAADEVTVPAEAVIRTGQRALVYLLDAPGRYRPVEVELGAEADGRIAIRRGIAAGQQVVASAQFLIDSEASLQGLTARGAPLATTEHQAEGRVTAVETDGLTLDHAPVPALRWPAMTMPFKLAAPQLARGLQPGDAVRFRFRMQGDDAVLTAVERTPATDPGAKR